MFFTSIKEKEINSLRKHKWALFPETCAIAHACAGTHASKFMCVIYCMREHSIFTFCFVIIDIYFPEGKLSQMWCTLFMERHFVWTVRLNV